MTLWSEKGVREKGESVRERAFLKSDLPLFTFCCWCWKQKFDIFTWRRIPCPIARCCHRFRHSWAELLETPSSKKLFFWKPIENSTKIKQGCFDFNADDFYRAENFGEKNPGAIILQPVVVEWPERRVRYVGGWFNKFESSPQKGTWVKTEGGGEREVGGVGAVEISVAHNRSPTDWQNLFGTGFLGPHESHSFLWKWLF